MPISTDVEVNLTMKDNFSAPAEKLFENFQKQAELNQKTQMLVENSAQQARGFGPSELIEQNSKQFERVSNSFEHMSRTSGQFGSVMGSTFDKLVYQGKGFEAVLFDLQRELSRMAIRAMASGIFNQLTGGIGSGMDFFPVASLAGFADGGRINAFQTAIVGERGPELFKPSVSGDIVPNHQLGGGSTFVNNFHFNVDAPTYMANQGQITADIARAIERSRRNT